MREFAGARSADRRPRRVSAADRPLPLAFIVGCARSGTSILGELIAAHRQVRYLFEANKIWERAQSAPDGSHRLTAADATQWVRRSLRREFHRTTPPPGGVIVEKCPRNALRIPFLRAVFPEARFVHIIRDGRDVACSLVPGLAAGKWLHLRPPGWRELERRYEGVVRCAMAWQSVVQLALADLAGSRQIEVRYEDLVRDPRGAARLILDFLDLPTDPAVFDFADRIQDRTCGSYQARFQPNGIATTTTSASVAGGKTSPDNSNRSSSARSARRFNDWVTLDEGAGADRGLPGPDVSVRGSARSQALPPVGYRNCKGLPVRGPSPERRASEKLNGGSGALCCKMVPGCGRGGRVWVLNWDLATGL